MSTLECRHPLSRQRGVLPLEWSASFTFTIMLLKMCELPLESISKPWVHKATSLFSTLEILLKHLWVIF
nr:Retrovirus-related Pol polyprotein from transposon TNT 1-94 [Ipomoea batatas]